MFVRLKRRANKKMSYPKVTSAFVVELRPCCSGILWLTFFPSGWRNLCCLLRSISSRKTSPHFGRSSKRRKGLGAFRHLLPRYTLRPPLCRRAHPWGVGLRLFGRTPTATKAVTQSIVKRREREKERVLVMSKMRKSK